MARTKRPQQIPSDRPDPVQAGSGAGPRHAAADPGSPDESYEATDSNDPLAEPPHEDEADPLEEGPPFAGISGGAVGGSPAEGRSSGGRTGRGIAPGGVHRGDSTVGETEPERRSRTRKKEKRQ